jgi:hypothetical protein
MNTVVGATAPLVFTPARKPTGSLKVWFYNSGLLTEGRDYGRCAHLSSDLVQDILFLARYVYGSDTVEIVWR